MRCMALPVIVVQETIADKFVALLKEKAMKLKVGCAYDADTKLGPVVSATHKENVCRWIQKGIDEGAELVLDGRDISVEGYEKGFFIGPTIFDHVKPGMTVGEREIFGPVTLIKRVKSFEEGISLMNKNPFANGSVIFTQNGYYARQFEFLTDGGMVGINVGIPVPSAYFPFSGNKDSFFGDLHVLGKDGVRFYTRAKTVTRHWYDEAAIQRKKEVETFILSRQILDFNWMGDFILGKHKKTITEEERNKFIEEYSKFLIRNYLSVLHYYTGDNYKIVSIEKQKNSSIYIVQTTVKYDNDKLIKNNFRIVEKNGKYYITDIITEGISFINAQRSEVNSLITSKGFDKFLEELKTRNATK